MMSNASQDTTRVSSGVGAEVGEGEAASLMTSQGLTAADRTELIQRMLREALDEPSPVAANLQVNGGDLLEMSLLLKKSIMEAARSSGDVAELKELQPFIDTYVKVCRQADRVLRLKHEITCTQRGDGSPSCRKNRD